MPLIFSGPGIKKGTRSNSPVELIDMYPTLMELTGIKAPDHVVGKSLVPIFNDSSYKIRNSALTRWIATRFNNVEGYSIKTERYRFVKWGENPQYAYINGKPIKGYYYYKKI